jgi:outer membrane protein assembly factor BamB
MIRRLSSLALCGLIIAAGLLASAAAAGDWPRYRGPAADGRSAETGLLATWPPAGPPELWRVPLGGGYSGISVVGDRLFTLFAVGKDEFAAAFDAASGRETWRVRIDRNRPDDQGDGPRATPTVDGDTVYTLSSSGKLHALEAASGKVRWTLDLVKEFDARVPRWGVATSPLVEADLLVVDVGGRAGYSLVAFDKTSGEVRWHANDDEAGYSTPLAVTLGEVRQIVSFSATRLSGVKATDGAALWSHPWRTAYDVNAAMPVFVPPNRLFISSGYDSGGALLQIDGKRVLELWRAGRMRNHFNSSVLVGDHLYGFDNAFLKCIAVANGEEKWATRGFAKGSLIYADGHLIVLGERGNLAWVEATPEDYRESAGFQLFNSKTWTMPSLANGRLFVRDQKELVALDLRTP